MAEAAFGETRLRETACNHITTTAMAELRHRGRNRMLRQGKDRDRNNRNCGHQNTWSSPFRVKCRRGLSLPGSLRPGCKAMAPSAFSRPHTSLGNPKKANQNSHFRRSYCSWFFSHKCALAYLAIRIQPMYRRECL